MDNYLWIPPTSNNSGRFDITQLALGATPKPLHAYELTRVNIPPVTNHSFPEKEPFGGYISAGEDAVFGAILQQNVGDLAGKILGFMCIVDGVSKGDLIKTTLGIREILDSLKTRMIYSLAPRAYILASSNRSPELILDGVASTVSLILQQTQREWIASKRHTRSFAAISIAVIYEYMNKMYFTVADAGNCRFFVSYSNENNQYVLGQVSKTHEGPSKGGITSGLSSQDDLIPHISTSTICLTDMTMGRSGTIFAFGITDFMDACQKWEKASKMTVYTQEAFLTETIRYIMSNPKQFPNPLQTLTRASIQRLRKYNEELIALGKIHENDRLLLQGLEDGSFVGMSIRHK